MGSAVAWQEPAARGTHPQMRRPAERERTNGATPVGPAHRTLPAPQPPRVTDGDLSLVGAAFPPRDSRGSSGAARPDSPLEWGEAKRHLERELHAAPPTLAAELRPAAEALRKLGIPVIGGVGGFGTRDGFPILKLGVERAPLTITTEGQPERATEELRRVAVPLRLRITAFPDLGFRALSLEALHAIDRPALRAHFPAFFAAAEEAFKRSATPPTGRPTEEEVFRLRLNLAVYREVHRLTSRFEHDHRASVGTPITVTSSTGEPCHLIAGDRTLSAGAEPDLTLNTLRSRIVASRLHALDRFAEFLKHEAALVRRPA